MSVAAKSGGSEALFAGVCPGYCFAAKRPRQETMMAKKTVRVSDISGEEIPDGKGAVVRITFKDARKGSRELDVTDAEAEKIGGRVVARRGRRPKAES